MCMGQRRFRFRLLDLSYFIMGRSIEEAVDRAIDECIREGILKEFLEGNRAEARAMSIYEYDQEEHIRLEREDAYEDGRKVGREEGREEGIELGVHQVVREQVEKKFKKGFSVAEISEMLEKEPELIEKIVAELEN